MNCCGAGGCATVSVIGAIIGALLAYILPTLINRMLDQVRPFSLLMLTRRFPYTAPLLFQQMEKGTFTYRLWENSTAAPTYVRFYVFNVTNIGDILNHNAKPKLQELGPYTFS